MLTPLVRELLAVSAAAVLGVEIGYVWGYIKGIAAVYKDREDDKLHSIEAVLMPKEPAPGTWCDCGHSREEHDPGPWLIAGTSLVTYCQRCIALPCPGYSAELL